MADVTFSVDSSYYRVDWMGWHVSIYPSQDVPGGWKLVANDGSSGAVTVVPYFNGKSIAIWADGTVGFPAYVVNPFDGLLPILVNLFGSPPEGV